MNGAVSTAGDNGITVTHTHYNILVNETNYGEGASVLYTSDYYWLATRYTFANSEYVDFGLRVGGKDLGGRAIYYSNNTNFYGEMHLRPVITVDYDKLTGTKDSNGAWELK